jgi:hypothetical protein
MKTIQRQVNRSCGFCGSKTKYRKSRQQWLWHSHNGELMCDNCYRVMKKRIKNNNEIIYRHSILRRGTQFGYIRIWRPTHPRAHFGYVLEHVIVMEDYLSKQFGFKIYLSRQWDIHHKNHNRADNRIENLQMMTHEAHAYHHAPDLGLSRHNNRNKSFDELKRWLYGLAYRRGRKLPRI